MSDDNGYDEVYDHAQVALASTQKRLTELRQQVKDYYAEIKQLVEEEDLLERILRVRKKETS
jgi:hypothetical protein